MSRLSLTRNATHARRLASGSMAVTGLEAAEEGTGTRRRRASLCASPPLCVLQRLIHLTAGGLAERQNGRTGSRPLKNNLAKPEKQKAIMAVRRRWRSVSGGESERGMER